MTIIRLFICCRCHAILDEKDTEKEIPCSCSGRMFKYAAPTKMNVMKYFSHHPRMLKIWFIENVLKRNS